MIVFIAALALQSVHATAGGDESVRSDEIVVTGTRSSTIDLDKLLKGQKRFEEGRVRLAPASKLLFQLSPQVGRRPVSTLRLKRGNQVLQLPIGPDATFSLPPGLSKEWELSHNRGAGEIRVRPLILSPGTSLAERRLGDLRLQCRVGWRMMETSVFVRSAFGAIGGCDSSKVAFYFQTERPIASGSVREGSRSLNLQISRDRREYRPPLYDRRLSNEARVRLNFASR